MTNIIDLLDNSSIYIPMIQRDYAYGRESEKTKVESFVNSIWDILTGKKDNLTLNYIYGVPNEEKKIVLIDGQQRVTTLYLFRLFLAVNAGEDVSSFSSKLTYATRTTSKDFCEFISKNSGVLKISGESSNAASDEKNNNNNDATIDIKNDNKKSGATVNKKLDNHKGFFKKWRNDPTVFSMITVLDMIKNKSITTSKEQFKAFLKNLKNVEFEFISLEGFKREEALYTAMNGRGKDLTEFEKIKPDLFELLKTYSQTLTIESTINNKWVPAFWNYAKEISGKPNEQEKNKYAAENHDRYLYNYFKYLLTMLWCENNVIEKNKKPAELDESLKWLKTTDDTTKANACDLILFAMQSFPDWSNTEFSKYLITSDDPSNKISSEQTNLFKWNFDLDLFKKCCEKNELIDFPLLERIILWAFIVFNWKKHNGKTNEKNLRDYFVLMRDVYANSWDSNTPTSLFKNPGEDDVAKGIKAFRQIIDGSALSDDNYTIQQDTFESINDEKYLILNNYCTRGCSYNIADVVQQKNGFTQEQAATFANNLYFLTDHLGIDNVKALESAEFSPFFICSYTKGKRLYLPFSTNMLASLFSMRNWSFSNVYSNITYSAFIQKLSKTDLSNYSNRIYTTNDWQWYVEQEKYKDCFINKESFSAFDFYNDGDTPKFFEMKGVLYGARATKRQSASPFILAAYKIIENASNVDSSLIAKCNKRIDKYDIHIEENDDSLYLKYTDKGVDKNHLLERSKDIVEQISEKLRDLDRAEQA